VQQLDGPGQVGLIKQGVTLAREHLALLGEARGTYKLGNADVAGVIKTWTQTRADLIKLYTEQGRRWQGFIGTVAADGPASLAR